MPEQRKSQRIPFREPVQYRLSSGQEPNGCLACDFSDGGVQFRVQDFIPLNSELFLDIPLPTQDIMKVVGRVAWIQKVPYGETYQVGVEFKSPGTKSRISEHFPAA